MFYFVARASSTVCLVSISMQVTAEGGHVASHTTSPSHGHIPLLWLGTRLRQWSLVFPQTPVQVSRLPARTGNGNSRATGSTREQTAVGSWRSPDSSEIPSFLCSYLRYVLTVYRPIGTKIVSILYAFAFSINFYFPPNLFSRYLSQAINRRS